MSSLPYLGLHQILKFWAENSPNSLAILAPERSPLNYEQLWSQVRALVAQFNTLGLGRHDRVAIALPNSPEMAVAFLASASCATCAPLNPGYKAPEFDFYLRDLQAKVLIVQAGIDSAAIAVAQALEIPIIELEPIPNSPAGIFTLKGSKFASPELPGFAAPADIALILHTSGTTSRPKIVPLSHQNLCTSAQNISTTLQLTQGDRCLNVMPLFHIHGLIACLLASLQAGASVVCTPGFYAPKFFNWLEELQPTWYSCVPTMHQAILARSGVNQGIVDRTSLRLIRSSSAALPPAVMAEIEAVFQAPVIEAYGMTEAAHQMASNPLPPGQRKPGSVGLAAGPEVSIMDEVGNLLPWGEIGEIVIRGANVTTGYENNPPANATAFSNGWFRTGDQGYLDQDQYLFIKDRIKEIINRGGEKISPREVDEMILTHPAIAQAVTFAMPHGQLGEEVAIAVVIHPDQEVTEREIQEFAALHLADFKVPRRVIFLPEIPKGATGKQQRIGLAEKLGITAPESTTVSTFAPPRTPLETTLAEIWGEVLGIEQIGREDNFFALGGDSLLAAQVINRGRSVLNLDLSILSFWHHPTLGDMAEALQESVLPTLPLQSITQADYPLSSTQVRMWLLEQLTPELAVYSQPLAIHLPDNVDLAILHQSLQEIIRRHRGLRSRFLIVDGQPRQEILPALTLDLPLVEVSHQTARSQDLAREFAQIPFDLSQGGLIRGTIFRLDAATQILLLVTHHIIFDGWSTGILLQELNVLYTAFSQGLPSPLPELPIQYPDFALWQQQSLITVTENSQRELAFWRKYLEGAPPLLELPLDRPRPQQQTYRGAKETLTLPPELRESLTALSRRSKVTLFVTLLAAFGTLLHRYTGAMDLVIGCPVAGRNLLETENLIGVFINTLPLRLRFENNPSFSELLQQVQATSWQALTHQDLPLEKIIEALQPERNSSYHPLFQVGFVLEPPRPDLEIGLARDFPVHNGTTKFDLSLEIGETALPQDSMTATGLVTALEYSTDLFDRPTIARMLGHFQVLLTNLVANPEQRISHVPLLTTTEEQLFRAGNSTQRTYPQDQAVHQLFEAQAAQNADAIAVVYEGQHLTYGELNAKANQLAHHLQSLGVKPEVLVGICVERSLQMMVGILGILKAGGAYVPLDPTYPQERLEFMLTDSAVPVLVTQSTLLHKLPQHSAQTICLDADWQAMDHHSQLNPLSGVTPDNLAYIIYTSGSTGKPKGVLIDHRNVLRLFAATDDWFHFNSEDVWTMFHSYAFDFSVWEIWGALIYGGRLVVVPYLVSREPRAFYDLLCAEKVTVLNQTPSAFRQLIKIAELTETADELKLRFVIFGGEALELRSLKPWFDRHGDSSPQLVNMYGITETTVHVTYYPIKIADLEAQGSLIGEAIPDLQIYILNHLSVAEQNRFSVGSPSLQLVPIGVAGELYIGGAGLARGYLNRPELTAERFIPNPFGTGKLYKTGDLARHLPDGNMEYLGRIDHQVKLRGFRIELGEIEAVLASHVVVQQAVVLVQEDVSGDQRLVAYLVFNDYPSSNSPISNSELRNHLREKLPDYMVPAAFVTLTAIPLTANGKIDRASLVEQYSTALLQPDFLSPDADNYLAPQTETEEAIARIWAEVLQLERMGIQDNFFDLGGHSLSAIRVITRLQEVLGISLSLRYLFESPTIEALASHIEALSYVQGAETNQDIDTEYEEFEL